MNNDYPLLLAAVSCLALLACNQVDPPMMTGTEGSASSAGSADAASGGPVDGDFFPLQDGATWTYRHVASDGATFDEIVVMREVTYNGAVAFEMEDNADSNGENTISTVAMQDGKVMRVHKEVYMAAAPVLTVDYDPGFLRFDNGWVEGDETNWMYDRTEYDETGALADEAVRQQIFVVESLSTSVTVPAGTFDCVQFLRTRPDTGASKRFWFADGVGKIKHQTMTTGTVEELSEYSIP